METSLDIPTSSGSLGKKKMMKMMMKKKKEEEDAREWLSYYGAGFKPYESLNVFVVQLIESDPPAILYQIDEFNDPPQAVNFLENFKPTVNVEVLGSLNGKIALYQDGRAYLFDPYLPGEGTLVKIPKPLRIPGLRGGFNPGLFGLCYDSVEDEYKGLLCDMETNANPNMVFICVLSFKRGTCSCICQHGLPYLSTLLNNTATIAKGVPYWLCKDLVDKSILKFDQKAEQLEILPGLPFRMNVHKLGTLDGQLTATIYEREKIEIWRFVERSDPRCFGWAPLFVLPKEACFVSTLSWMIKDVEVLLKANEGKLLVYNFREGRMRLLSMALQRKIKGSHCITVACKPILND